MTQMIRYRIDAQNDMNDIQSICRTVSDCVEAIGICNRFIRDGKNIRTGKWPSNSATVWEMRQALGWTGNQDVDKKRYKGKVLSNGDVEVFDKLEDKFYHITSGELSQIESNHFASKNEVSTINGRPVLSNGVFTPRSAYEVAGPSGKKIIAAVAGVAAVVTIIGGILKTIDEASKGIKATADIATSFGSRIKGALSSLFRAKNKLKTETSGQNVPGMKEVMDKLDALSQKVDDLTKKKTKKSMAKKRIQMAQRALAESRRILSTIRSNVKNK